MPGGKQYFDALIDYWKSLPRRDDPVPAKTSFSPMQLYKMLPYLYFNEWLGDYNLKVRLMGEKLEERARESMPNRNVFESLARSDWDEMNDFNRAFCKQPCAGFMHRLVTVGAGLVLDVETVGLPLLSPDGQPTFVVGLAEFNQNSTLSLKAQRENSVINEIVCYDYIDVGYGVPREGHADKKACANMG